ncbi:C2 family cysteine protease [Frankia sp. AgB32]|uniref:C2 family cysteine protease n=1 Tax=Frankia sp. AgB32 TaxID=631119 RepID=UPI00200C4B64|nr:C2 family cysteine protease [Frankia sp. AgB32]MCK9893211.1 C2 family cysteine protease [Frankia sp. AgB32]
MRCGPASAAGAGLPPGSAEDLRGHAATLRRLATELTAGPLGIGAGALAVLRTGGSPLQARLETRLTGWARALDADAEALRRRAAWLDRLAAAESGAGSPPVRMPPVGMALVGSPPVEMPCLGAVTAAEPGSRGAAAGVIRLDPIELAAFATRLRRAGRAAQALLRVVGIAVTDAGRAAHRAAVTVPADVGLDAAAAGRGLRAVAAQAPAVAADLERGLTRLAAAPILRPARRPGGPEPAASGLGESGLAESGLAVFGLAAGLLALLMPGSGRGRHQSAGGVPTVADLRTARARLASLTGAERAGVIGALRGDPLVVLAALAERLMASLGPATVLVAAELAGLADDLLAGAPRAMVAELVRVLPWLEPAAPIPTGDGRPGPVLEVDRSGDPLVLAGAAPGDVGQGGVADCYLAAALIGVAHQNPGRIADGLRRNPNGTVTVTLHPGGGGGVAVTVTATLPARRLPGTAGGGLDSVQELAMDADNGADQPELWPALYEKAYARLHGGYPRIGYGSAADGLRTLTGRPVGHRDAGGFAVADLAGLLRGGAAVTVTTRSRTRPGGLAAAHAYALLAVDVRGGRVLLRNPWDPPPGETNERWYPWSWVVPDARTVAYGATR